MERDSRGKFKKGNQAGAKDDAAEIHKFIRKLIFGDPTLMGYEGGGILKELVKMSQNGKDSAKLEAAKLLFAYFLGKPTERIITENHNIDENEMSAGELAKRAKELLDGLNGLRETEATGGAEQGTKQAGGEEGKDPL